MTRDKTSAYQALHDLVSKEHRNSVLTRAISYRPKATTTAKSSFNNAARVLRVDGFNRNPGLAPKERLLPVMKANLFCSADLVTATLELWVESHADLNSLVQEYMSHNAVSLDGLFQREEESGRIVGWSPDVSETAARFSATYPQYGFDDVALLICCVEEIIHDPHNEVEVSDTSNPELAAAIESRPPQENHTLAGEGLTIEPSTNDDDQIKDHSELMPERDVERMGPEQDLSIIEGDHLLLEQAHIAREQIASSQAYRNLDTYLAGVMHDERYLGIPQLSLRDVLQLRPEPDNPADANAILVETQNGQQIGHIRRELASYLAPHIDAETPAIQAKITELSRDARDSAYRVRINFRVPAEWLNRQEIVEHLSGQPTEYTYDDTGPNVYVMINSSEDQFNQVREKLTADNISHSRYGLCYRDAPNGRAYRWYIRLDKTAEVNKPLIQAFFRRNFNVAPEFEPVEVLEAKERSEAEILELTASLKKAEENLAAKRGDIGKQELQLKAREAEVRQIDDEKRRLKHDNENLKKFPIFRVPDHADDTPERISDLLKEVISETLTPLQSLSVIKRLFPTRIEVLDPAFKSAEKSESFRKNKKLFSLLWDLAMGYWYALANGGGDVEARLIFGENYAAQESESVQKNPDLRKLRTFPYKGQQLEMMKHLKIGVKPGVSDSIRVHFEWVASQRIIVIGYCGRHLPLK